MVRYRARLSGLLRHRPLRLGFTELGDVGDFEAVSTSAFTGTLSLRFDL